MGSNRVRVKNIVSVYSDNKVCRMKINLSILNQNEKEVRKELSKFLSTSFNSPFISHTLHGFGNIDLYASFPEYVYVIEVELKREDPVNNVAKIYRYLEEDGSEFEGNKLIFIHAFSPHYNKGGALTKRKNAEFIGNKMSQEYNNVTYTSIEFNSMESLKNRIINAIKSKRLNYV